MCLGSWYSCMCSFNKTYKVEKEEESSYMLYLLMLLPVILIEISTLRAFLCLHSCFSDCKYKFFANYLVDSYQQPFSLCYLASYPISLSSVHSYFTCINYIDITSWPTLPQNSFTLSPSMLVRSCGIMSCNKILETFIHFVCMYVCKYVFRFC